MITGKEDISSAARPGQTGFINLDAKLLGKPGAGNPHAGVDAVGIEKSRVRQGH